METYREIAARLRAQEVPHINCAQAVVIPFAKEAGISEETVMRFADGFGGGMKMGSVCGAVSGAVMALGLFGLGNPETLGQLYRKFLKNHNDMIDCRDLLRVNAEAGNEKKPFCDGMVLECVDLVEEILKENGKI